MRSNIRYSVATAVIALAFFAGCGKKYAGASEQTYRIATALVAICDRKLTDKLPQVEQLINDGQDSGDISSYEADYLKSIIELARNGSWPEAGTTARQILSDQVDD